MKQLTTEILIDAPTDKVWAVLTDFKNYPTWNPFITSIEGNVEEGRKFKINLQAPDSKPMTFKPKCLKMEKDKEFRWVGHMIIPGLFDGEHIFELIELKNNQTKLIHREEFNGLLLPLFWNKMEAGTKKGFELMNERLREVAEAA